MTDFFSLLAVYFCVIMGRRGPPPKPQALRDFEGDASNRPRRPCAAEMEAAPDASEPPDVLDAEGKAEWRSLYPILQRSRLLTAGDLSALTVYCSLWSRWVEAERALRAEASVLPATKTSRRHANPWVAISQNAASLMKGYLIEFGLTPAARTRLAVVGPNGAQLNTAPIEAGRFAGPIGRAT